jgi:hypothetical protein
MYFMTRGGAVCHVLHDTRNGAAPCGVKVEKLELVSYKAGKPAPLIVAEKPANVPLCKQCKKHDA